MGTLSWPTDPPVLNGDGIRLRPWNEGDIVGIHRACGDAEIQRWTLVESPYLIEHAEDYVATAPQRWLARTAAPFCVAALDDDRVLGSCALVDVNTDDLVGEIGCWIAPWSRGRKVAQHAVGALVDWAFSDGGLFRLEMLIEPDNLASRGVAEAVGGVEEGVLRSKGVSRDGRVDLVLYALVKEPTSLRS